MALARSPEGIQTNSRGYLFPLVQQNRASGPKIAQYSHRFQEKRQDHRLRLGQRLPLQQQWPIRIPTQQMYPFSKLVMSTKGYFYPYN
jgi:hypothetical protein